jgi:hypothetical protein
MTEQSKTPPPLPDRPSTKITLQSATSTSSSQQQLDPFGDPIPVVQQQPKLDPFGDPILDDHPTTNNNNNLQPTTTSTSTTSTTTNHNNTNKPALGTGVPPPRPPRPQHMNVEAVKAREAMREQQELLLKASGITFGKEERATKFTYNTATGQWNMEACRLRIATKWFSEGGMRQSYRAAELIENSSRINAGVVKLFKNSNTKPGVVFHEALTQAVAQRYADAFNDLCARKKCDLHVTFLPVWVLLLSDRVTPYGDNVYATLEPFLPGTYVKFSDNSGRHLNDVAARAAQTFSHYTFLASGRKLVCVDIQGIVAMSLPGEIADSTNPVHTSFKVMAKSLTLTDPQIHSVDGNLFGAGNLGVNGIKAFIASYSRTEYDEMLGLAPLTQAQALILPPPSSVAQTHGKNEPLPFNTDELASRLAHEAHSMDESDEPNSVHVTTGGTGGRLTVDPKRIQDFTKDGEVTRLSMRARDMVLSISSVI